MENIDGIRKALFLLDGFCKLGACASVLLLLQASFVLVGWNREPIPLIGVVGTAAGPFLAVTMVGKLEAALQQVADNLQKPVGNEYSQPLFPGMWGFRMMIGNSGGLIDRIHGGLGHMHGRVALWAAFIGFVTFCAATTCTGIFVTVWSVTKAIHWMGDGVPVLETPLLFPGVLDDSSIFVIFVVLLLSSALWMTYQNHLDVFDHWRRKSGLEDRSLCECLDLYCAGLPLDQYAIGNVRDFLIETIRR